MTIKILAMGVLNGEGIIDAADSTIQRRLRQMA
jgi:hypothetical protein